MEVKKMNYLYKIAFGLLMLCLPLLVVSIIFAYLFEEPDISVWFAAGGSLIALAGIILAMLSKQKKAKKKKSKTDEQELIEKTEEAKEAEEKINTPEDIDDNDINLVLTHINSDDII